MTSSTSWGSRLASARLPARVVARTRTDGRTGPAGAPPAVAGFLGAFFLAGLAMVCVTEKGERKVRKMPATPVFFFLPRRMLAAPLAARMASLLPRCAVRPPRPCRRLVATASASASTPADASASLPASLRVTVADVESTAGRARLDAFLAAKLPSESRARLAAAVKSGSVAVNGAPAARSAARVRPGDVVTVASRPPPPPLHAVPEAADLDIVYEDGALIVVNKAAGVVVHPAPGARGGTLVNALLHHVGVAAAAEVMAEAEEVAEIELAAAPLPDDDDDDGAPFPTPAPLLTPSGVRPGIVHRLDRGTSGLLVVAKTAAAHASLGAQFRARRVTRVYEAILSGTPTPPSATVETNIERDPRDRTRMAAAPYGCGRGRQASSSFCVVETLAGGAATRTEWRLATGRTHQIRVHAAHVGHPIVGDAAYRGTSAGVIASLGKARAGAALRAASGGAIPKAATAAAARLVESIGRPALHARVLGFVHPVSGEEVVFEAAPPDDFGGLVEALRVWGE